ncbi:MAG: phosphatase PAP2 family protein [bacterium]|nr:phosphatase PAP2 family protein [bacterium]
MRHYLATFKRIFPGAHYVFASLVLVFGIFTLIYALGVSQGLFLRSFITNLDKNVLDIVLVQRGDTRSGFFLFFTYLGNWEIIASLSTVILTVMLLARKIRAMWFFIIALAFGQASSLIFKYLLTRNRPDTAHALIEQGGYSFPSGHALGAFIFYGVCAYFLCTLLKKRWQKNICTLTAIVVIGLIGLSRMYLGVHWLSDVIAGWLMGATLLIVFIVFFEHRKRLFPTIHRPTIASNQIILGISIVLTIGEIFFIWYFYISHPFKSSTRLPSLNYETPTMSLSGLTR